MIISGFSSRDTNKSNRCKAISEISRVVNYFVNIHFNKSESDNTIRQQKPKKEIES